MQQQESPTLGKNRDTPSINKLEIQSHREQTPINSRRDLRRDDFSEVSSPNLLNISSIDTFDPIKAEIILEINKRSKV